MDYIIQTGEGSLILSASVFPPVATEARAATAREDAKDAPEEANAEIRAAKAEREMKTPSIRTRRYPSIITVRLFRNMAETPEKQRKAVCA